MSDYAEHVTQYSFFPNPADELRPITVTRTRFDGDVWAIRCGALCLNHGGEWEWEPQPSSRDDEFFARCRFNLDAALAIASESELP